MNSLTRTIILFAIPALLPAHSLLADDPQEVRDTNASQVAEAWFVSLMKGNTAVTTSLSEVPFSFDRKQEVGDLKQLRNIYDQIVSKKGKRDLVPSSIEVKSPEPEKVEVVLMVGDEGVLVLIKPGDAYKVIGFSD